jgi:hypothetical protein
MTEQRKSQSKKEIQLEWENFLCGKIGLTHEDWEYYWNWDKSRILFLRYMKEQEQIQDRIDKHSNIFSSFDKGKIEKISKFIVASTERIKVLQKEFEKQKIQELGNKMKDMLEGLKKIE